MYLYIDYILLGYSKQKGFKFNIYYFKLPTAATQASCEADIYLQQ